jgi:hypothetical protein
VDVVPMKKCSLVDVIPMRKMFIGGRGTNEKYQIFEKILEE